MSYRPISYRLAEIQKALARAEAFGEVGRTKAAEREIAAALRYGQDVVRLLLNPARKVRVVKGRA